MGRAGERGPFDWKARHVVDNSLPPYDHLKLCSCAQKRVTIQGSLMSRCENVDTLIQDFHPPNSLPEDQSVWSQECLRNQEALGEAHKQKGC